MRHSGIRVLRDRGPVRGTMSADPAKTPTNRGAYVTPGPALPVGRDVSGGIIPDTVQEGPLSGGRVQGASGGSTPAAMRGPVRTSSSGLRVQLDSSVSLRTDTYLGHSYLIVPVISQVGDSVVWPANAPSPELIPADVLQLATEARNNRPVVMGHPQTLDGEYISANDPAILERYCFGHYFGTGYRDGRVKGEMWISKERAESLPDESLRSQALDAITRIEAGSMVEVSEGNYVVIEDEEGEHDGQEYNGRWILAIPDHLAILPEGTEGACSVANHGCGAPRVNQARLLNNETPAVHQGVAGVRIDVCGGVDQPAKGKVPHTRDGVNLSASKKESNPAPTFPKPPAPPPPPPIGSVNPRRSGEHARGHDVTVPRTEPRVEPRVAALSQARTPTYTGTEPVPARWTVPSFAQYVRYLHPGDSSTAPRTVSACDSALKARIAEHSLLGDPSAASFRDLTLLPVVNPASGKLNERALRSVVARTSLSGVSDSTLSSAQDVARRLLNAEFPSVTVSAASVETHTMKKSLKERFMSLFRPEMSSNQLRNRLLDALREVDPDVSYVTDEDQDEGTVFYATTDYGTWESSYWRRTFTLDTDGMPTVNDDRISVEPVMRYEPTPASATESESEASMSASTASSDHEPSVPCSCHQHKGETTTMQTLKERLIAQITARPRNKFTVKALTAMDDETLLAADDATRDRETEKEKKESDVNPDGTTGDGGKSTPTPAAVPLPSHNPQTEVHPVPPEEQIRAQAKIITLPTDQYLALKAQADAQAQIETQRRDAVLQTLSSVMKVTDGIKALPLADLEALAESATGQTFPDYSMARVTTSANSGSTGLPQGWEGYETPDTYGLRANQNQGHNQKKTTN